MGLVVTGDFMIQAQTHAQNHTWEHELLSLAHEARYADFAACRLDVDAATLNQAYEYCEAVTAVHSRSFHLASGFLPAEKRRATRALYAFCRVTDDIVDRGQGDAPVKLEQWRRLVLATTPPAEEMVALAWTDARLRYNVPVRFAEQLIDGVARDLQPVRYTTFEELTAYCYGVASTVGLMSMYIIGYAGAQAIPYAIKLGVALQLTNILRDVGEDWQAGRLYLPQADLQRFGLTEVDVAAGVESGVISERWRAFMRYQIARNRSLYAEAMSGVALLDRDGRFAIRAAAELYCTILSTIETQDYNVFTHRARVSTWGKLRRLPGIWWRSKTNAE